MDRDRQLRDQLVGLLGGGHAHMGFEQAIADFPLALINVRPPNVEYTFWHLIEHLRITQADILEYVKKPAYEAPTWPDDYWPPRNAQATEDAWRQSIEAFRQDLEEIIALVADEATDLYATVPSHDTHTILREALLVADHNAYHIGELGILRQVVNAWGRNQDV